MTKAKGKGYKGKRGEKEQNRTEAKQNKQYGGKEKDLGEEKREKNKKTAFCFSTIPISAHL